MSGKSVCYFERKGRQDRMRKGTQPQVPQTSSVTSFFVVYLLTVVGLLVWVIALQVQISNLPNFGFLAIAPLEQLTVVSDTSGPAYVASEHATQFLFIAAFVGEEHLNGSLTGSLTSFCSITTDFIGNGTTAASVDITVLSPLMITLKSFGFPIQLPVFVYGTDGSVSPGFIMAVGEDTLRCLVTPQTGVAIQTFMTSPVTIPLTGGI